ncbi:MAG: Bug family tripartite tricarboxylate transporter substrate binding protein [Burkholderiales bacterium]
MTTGYPRNSKHRYLASVPLLAMLLIASNVLAQQAYPNKPIKLITPYTTGGMTDLVTRTIAQHFSDRLGQAVVTENRAGANGAIAMEAVAKSAPDGHTLLLASITNYVFLPASRKSLPFDTVRDFTSVTMASTTPMYLVVHPSLPARNVQELIDLGRSQPGKFNYASTGIGSSQHLVMELFKTRTKAQLYHVPFKGSAQAMVDMISGEVQVMFQGPTSTLPLMQSGKLRALAITDTKRSPTTPNVPTVAESGVPGFDFSTWSGIVVPSAVPRAIVNRLNSVAGELLKSQAVIDKFAPQNIDLLYSTPEAMDERIRRELPLFTKVMRDAGIEAE